MIAHKTPAVSSNKDLTDRLCNKRSVRASEWITHAGQDTSGFRTIVAFWYKPNVREGSIEIGKLCNVLALKDILLENLPINNDELELNRCGTIETSKMDHQKLSKHETIKMEI